MIKRWLVLIPFLLMLGCTNDQDVIQQLEKEIDHLEAVINELSTENRLLKSNTKPESNTFFIEKKDMKYLIEYEYRSFPSNLYTLMYENEYYVPISFIAKELGERLNIMDDSVIVIGDTITSEGLVRTDYFLNSRFERIQFQKVLGMANKTESNYDPCLQGDITTDYYDGLTVAYEYDQELMIYKVLSLQLDESILTTSRGITVGSTLNEVQLKYGIGRKVDENKVSYGTITFEFKENKVTKIIVTYFYVC